MTKEERIAKLKKFTDDPDFHLLIDLIKEHLAPLESVSSIDRTLSNDQIASEVRGRQLSMESMSNFLSDISILKGSVKDYKPTTFK